MSIIIPVYRVEQFIEKCSRSLFEQSLEDVEFIFINDCTPDASIEILMKTLEDYPQRKEQVRIIDMEHNSGQAVVRERGFRLATGDYVISCDSDDWIDHDMYRIMYETAIEESLDVVICDYYLTDGINHQYWGQHYTGDTISGLLINWLSSSTCNKMVRKSIFARADFVFPVENICEDFVFNIQYFIYGPKVGYVDKALYYYYRHEDNSTIAMSEDTILKKFHQIVHNVDSGLKILADNGLAKKYSSEIVRQKLFVKNNLLPVIGNNFALWHKTYAEINGKVYTCRSIPFRDKCLYALTDMHLYPLYQKIKLKR